MSDLDEPPAKILKIDVSIKIIYLVLVCSDFALYTIYVLWEYSYYLPSIPSSIRKMLPRSIPGILKMK